MIIVLGRYFYSLLFKQAIPLVVNDTHIQERSYLVLANEKVHSAIFVYNVFCSNPACGVVDILRLFTSVSHESPQPNPRNSPAFVGEGYCRSRQAASSCICVCQLLPGFVVEVLDNMIYFGDLIILMGF